MPQGLLSARLFILSLIRSAVLSLFALGGIHMIVINILVKSLGRYFGLRDIDSSSRLLQH